MFRLDRKSEQRLKIKTKEKTRLVQNGMSKVREKNHVTIVWLALNIFNLFAFHFRYFFQRRKYMKKDTTHNSSEPQNLNEY